MFELTRFDIFDAAIAPDGQRALLLFDGVFESDIVAFGCPYDLEMRATGYLVADLSAEVLVVWRLTAVGFDACSTCGKLDPQDCADWIRTDLRQMGVLSSPEFEPASASILFGGT